MEIIVGMFVCLLVIPRSILNADISPSTNKDADRLNTDYDNKELDSNQEDAFDMYSSIAGDRDGYANKIDLIIASIRESSVDILQDIGDLEDVLLDRHDIKNYSISSTTSKFVYKDIGVYTKSANNNMTEQSKVDVLEEGKEKVKLWEEQLKACKSILNNSQLSKSKKNEEWKKKSNKVIAKIKDENDEDRYKQKAQRKRRRLLLESMENLRPVYLG